jgi:dihydrodipicolinate synthase/N-acetylneuraminate lyase
MDDTLKGGLAADLTPLEGERLASHSCLLLKNICGGIAVLGTIDEANSINLSQRITIFQSLDDAGIPSSALMPGTGSNSISETVEMSNWAVELLGLGEMQAADPISLFAATCHAPPSVG